MRWILLGFGVLIVTTSQWVGFMTQPWARWYVASREPIPVSGPIAEPVDIPQVAHGFVSDRQRYLLARAAGWTEQEAITAVAISIAEDGSGDPAALSGANFNGSRDLGLWQVNSGWWARFGGQQALIEPFNNALAAHAIYLLQGWCAWSTFEAHCGPGHTGSYAAYLGRARAASVG